MLKILNRQSLKSQNVLVICINYNNAMETVTFARSVISLNNTENLKIAIVDNSSQTLQSVSRHSNYLHDLGDKVIIMEPGTNLGYLGGAAWGFLEYRKKYELPDWVIISNTDISFCDSDFFIRLFEGYPAGYPGVIAPSITSSALGKEQNPFMERRPSKRKIMFYVWLRKLFIISWLYQMLSSVKQHLKSIYKKKLGAIEDPLSHKQRDIYSPHGSFVIFHKNFFELGGNLEYGGFLFGEEIFIAETIRMLGLNIHYDPRLKVIHREHTTIGRVESRKLTKFRYQSAEYCYKRFFSDN